MAVLMAGIVGATVAVGLVMASCKYESVKRTTRSIVLLATPLGKTFENIAYMGSAGSEAPGFGPGQ